MTPIKPVRSKTVPQYPSYGYLEEHPELLCILPERWRHNDLVLRVLSGVVCLVLASQSAAGQNNAAPPSRIAPLFVHGQGRGAFGCVAVNPPVFLSEDEAQQVIQEEAKKVGLEFAPNAFTLRNVNVPVTEPYWCPKPKGEPDKQPNRSTQQSRDLVLDGFDRKHNVAYEFVSQRHFADWETKNPRCISTVSSYDLKGTAEALRAGLTSSTQVPWTAVFYEPGAAARGNVNWEQLRRNGRELGEKELRKQVRDFIHWLKAQGVI